MKLSHSPNMALRRAARSEKTSGRSSGKQPLQPIGVAAWQSSREGRFNIWPSARQIAIISCSVRLIVASGGGEPGGPEGLDADAVVMVEVDHIRPQPRHELAEQPERAPVLDREMQEIVKLREVEVLPGFAMQRHDGGTGFAVLGLVGGFERADQEGLVPLGEARAEELVGHLLGRRPGPRRGAGSSRRRSASGVPRSRGSAASRRGRRDIARDVACDRERGGVPVEGLAVPEREEVAVDDRGGAKLLALGLRPVPFEVDQPQHGVDRHEPPGRGPAQRQVGVFVVAVDVAGRKAAEALEGRAPRTPSRLRSRPGTRFGKRQRASSNGTPLSKCSTRKRSTAEPSPARLVRPSVSRWKVVSRSRYMPACMRVVSS